MNPIPKAAGAEGSGTKVRAARARKAELKQIEQQSEFPLALEQRVVKAQRLRTVRWARELRAEKLPEPQVECWLPAQEKKQAAPERLQPERVARTH